MKTLAIEDRDPVIPPGSTRLSTAERTAADAVSHFIEQTRLDYDDFSGPNITDLDKVLRELDVHGIPQSYATFDDLVGKFNLSRLPDYQNIPNAYVGHLLFTRPNLFVDVNGTVDFYPNGSSPADEPNARRNYGAMTQDPKSAGFVSDPAGKMLLNMLSCQSSSYYMPLFSTRAMDYTVNDVSLKTIEKGTTFYGHNIKYGHFDESHKIGGTIQLQFRNDRFWSVLKAAYIWMCYIHFVSKTEAVKPHILDQMYGVLDYAGSIYYLVTLTDMRTLVYWEKLTGVFPKTAPFSMFNYSDAPEIDDKLTIEFDYGLRSEPNDPSILYDINMLAGYNADDAAVQLASLPGIENKNMQYSSYNRFDNWQGTGGIGDAWASRPIIHSVTNRVDGTITYLLDWLR